MPWLMLPSSHPSSSVPAALVLCVLAAGCGPTLAPFEGATLWVQFPEECEATETSLWVQLLPAGDCPTLDAEARLLLDGAEVELRERGGTVVVFGPPELPVPVYAIPSCNPPFASVPLRDLEEEHELRFETGNDSIEMRFRLPDQVLTCTGVASCQLEMEPLGFECGLPSE